MEKAHAKEYEKILKVHPAPLVTGLGRADLIQTVSSPLKEGHHFDQSLGGIAGLFESIRSNTQVRTPKKVRQMSPLTVSKGHCKLSSRDGEEPQRFSIANTRTSTLGNQE